MLTLTTSDTKLASFLKNWYHRQKMTIGKVQEQETFFFQLFQCVMTFEGANDLSPLELFILLRFAKRAIETNKMYVQDTAENLASWLKLGSVNTLRKGVSGLEELGLLKIQPGGTSQQPRLYLLTLPSPPELPIDQLAPSQAGSTNIEDPIKSEDLKEILRILLFLKGQRLGNEDLVRITGYPLSEIKTAIKTLQEEYINQSIQITETAGGYQMESRKEFSEYAQKVASETKTRRLTPYELDVLAIIFYNPYPPTRREIGSIRGQQPIETLNSLIRRGIVETVPDSEDDIPRYRPTAAALDHFGLKDLSELPPVDRVRPGSQGQPSSSNIS